MYLLRLFSDKHSQVSHGVGTHCYYIITLYTVRLLSSDDLEIKITCTYVDIIVNTAVAVYNFIRLWVLRTLSRLPKPTDILPAAVDTGEIDISDRYYRRVRYRNAR